MAAVEDLGDRRIARFASDLGQFDALSAGLGESVETAQSVVRATADLFEQTAQMVATRTGQAHTALAQVGSKIGQTHGIIDRLDRQARAAEGVSLPQSGLQDYLSALRGKYTMAAERTLHDALVADLSPGQAAPPLAPEPQAESAGGDDLDDIFF